MRKKIYCMLLVLCTAIIAPVLAVAAIPAKATGGPYFSTAGNGGKLELEAFDQRGGFGVSLRYSRVSTNSDLTPSTVSAPYQEPPDIFGVATTVTTGSLTNVQSQFMAMGTYNRPVRLNDNLTLRLTGGVGLGVINNSAVARMSYHTIKEYLQNGQQLSSESDSASNISLDATTLAAGIAAKAELEFRNGLVVGIGVDAAHGFGSGRPGSSGLAPSEALGKIPSANPTGVTFGVGFKF